jgi:hypothetical protein
MPKQQLTLMVEADLVERVKIQAVLDKRTVSSITEEMYREYLARKSKKRGK